MNSHSKLKKLLSGASIYLAASILSALLPFLIIPILTQYLAPAEFGDVGIFQAMLTITLTLVTLGMQGAIVRENYDKENDISRFIYNCLNIALISFIVLSVFNLVISYFVNIEQKITVFFAVSLMFSFLFFIIQAQLSQYQVNEKPKNYFFLQVGLGLSIFILSLIFIVFFEFGIWGRVFGFLFAALIFATVTIRILINYYGKITLFKLEKKYSDKALKFGVPLIPHELGTFVINWLALFYINEKLALFYVGIYTFAFQVSSVVGVACDAFNKAFAPWLFKRLTSDTEVARRSVVSLSYGYFFSLFVVVLLSVAILPWIVTTFFNESYREALTVLPLLLLGQMFGGYYLVFVNYILYVRKSHYLTYITVVSGTLNIILLSFLVDIYGIIGAAVSFCLSRLTQFVLTVMFSHHCLQMPWWTSKKLNIDG